MSKTFGLDLIGLLGFSSKITAVIARELPENCALGCLIDTTFNASIDNLKRLANLYTLLDTGKITTVKLSLFNTTAVRNQKLQPQELLYGYTVKSLEKDALSLAPKLTAILDKQLSVVRGLTQKYPNVQFNVSPFLEHDLTVIAAKKVLDYILLKTITNFTIINNPLKSQSLLAYPLEQHGNTPARCAISSNDGSSVMDGDVEKYKLIASDLSLIWIHEFNKNFTGGKTFIYPLKRKVEPYRHQIRHCIRLFNVPLPIPTTPKGFEKARVLDGKKWEVFKPWAEDYKTIAVGSTTNDDGRGSKPMIILPQKADTIDVYDKTGKKKAFFKYYGTYSGKGGGYRYYMGSGSGQTNEELVEKTGQEWFWLKAPGVLLYINILRRSGYYRPDGATE